MVDQKSLFHAIDCPMTPVEVCSCIVDQNIQLRELFVELICELPDLLKIAKIRHQEVNRRIASLCAYLLGNILYLRGISPNRIISYPCSARIVAAAFPIPDVAPVIKQIRFLLSISVYA